MERKEEEVAVHPLLLVINEDEVEIMEFRRTLKGHQNRMRTFFTYFLLVKNDIFESIKEGKKSSQTFPLINEFSSTNK